MLGPDFYSQRGLHMCVSCGAASVLRERKQSEYQAHSARLGSSELHTWIFEEAFDFQWLPLTKRDVGHVMFCRNTSSQSFPVF